MPGPASRGLTSMVVRTPGARTIGGLEEKVIYPLDIRTVMGVRGMPGNTFDMLTTQRYTCVMIPELTDIGGPWKVLPPGIHDATLDEVEMRFASNSHRRNLFQGLLRAVQALRHAGCSTVYLDGSFVTEKPTPGDFDACWDDSGVEVNRLDRALLDFKDKRRAQKQKFMGELFPAGTFAMGGKVFIDFFQTDRHTGEPKGIIRIRL